MTKAFFKTTKQGRTPARVARGVRSNRVVRLSGSEAGQPVGLEANTAHSASLGCAHQWAFAMQRGVDGSIKAGPVCRRCGAQPAKPNPSHHDGAAPAPSVDGVVQSPNREK